MAPAKPLIVCLNPWVYDFAAHDFFARPLGLLYLAGVLRTAGYRVVMLDCASRPPDNHSPKGRWLKEVLPTPRPLRGVPRRYGRYGMSLAGVQAVLSSLPQKPAAFLVTSLMTYWYPGVQAAIAAIRNYYPHVPVILGGIYATLLPEHAKKCSGADYVLPGPGEGAILPLLAELTGFAAHDVVINGNLDSLPYPAWDLLADHRVLSFLTSRGCPLKCDYCASRQLEPRFRLRQPENVVKELIYWYEQLGVTEIAWYDDALLFNADTHLLPLLAEICRRGLPLRFHTPNAIHVALINQQVAQWLKRANFISLRLGLETTATGEGRLDHKIQPGDLERAVAALHEAGFNPEDIGVYLLIGLPHQEDDEVIESIRQVRRLGAIPVLTQYSPIPQTRLWDEAVKVSRYDLEADPLYHNNSIFPCWPEFSWPLHPTQKFCDRQGELKIPCQEIIELNDRSFLKIIVVNDQMKFSSDILKVNIKKEGSLKEAHFFVDVREAKDLYLIKRLDSGRRTD